MRFVCLGHPVGHAEQIAVVELWAEISWPMLLLSPSPEVVEVECLSAMLMLTRRCIALLAEQW